jgi:NADH dehydrogenase
MQDKVICIFGGTGFLGQYVTQELARAGYRIKIATRLPESAYDLKTHGNVGQIVAVPCDYKDQASIQQATNGCHAVINLIGILYQKGKNSFQHAHVDIPSMITKACKKNAVKKFIHISALGIEASSSKYAKSKLDGEKEIHKEFPDATIMRPSVVFGPGDSFLNMFARLSTLLPALPLIGGGETKFQPVYVGDIADAVHNIVNEKSHKYAGETYHLGGPDIVSFKEIYEMILDITNRDRALITVPWGVAKIQGFVLGLLPKPLLTVDQVRSLKTDNIITGDVKTLKDLCVEPTSMQTIVPQYLTCYRRGGRFADKKSA